MFGAIALKIRQREDQLFPLSYWVTCSLIFIGYRNESSILCDVWHEGWREDELFLLSLGRELLLWWYSPKLYVGKSADSLRIHWKNLRFIRGFSQSTYLRYLQSWCIGTSTISFIFGCSTCPLKDNIQKWQQKNKNVAPVQESGPKSWGSSPKPMDER